MNEKPETWLARAGVGFKLAGTQIAINCPSCGKVRHCYVDRVTGLWNCKRCDAKGNSHTLQKMLGLVLDVDRAIPGAAESERLRADQYARSFDKFREVSDVEKWSIDLQENSHAQAAREYLVGARGLELDTLKKHGVGWLAELPSAPKVPLRRVSSVVARHSVATDAETSKTAQSDAPSNGTGWIVLPVFEARNENGSPEWSSLKMCKLRSVPPAEKSFRRIDGGTSALFVLGAINFENPILIVGGEIDALSVWQSGFENVISSTLGETSWSDEWTEKLERARDIVIAYDADDAGTEGAKKLAKKLGAHRCRIAPSWKTFSTDHDLSKCKDANEVSVTMGDDFDLFGVEAFIKRAVSTGEDGIVRFGSLKQRFMESISAKENTRGAATPWRDLDLLIGGRRPKELIVITGAEGSGKSTFATQWAMHECLQGVPTLLIPLELGVIRQTNKIVRQCIKCDPAEDLEKTERFFTKHAGLPLWQLEKYGSIDVEQLRNTITFCASRFGVRIVVVDHLHFAIGDEEKSKGKIEAITKMLAQVAMQENITVFCVAHPGKFQPKQGEQNRDNAVVQSNDLKGSSSIKQDADVVLSIWRERLAERTQASKKKRPKDGYATAMVAVLKCRSDYGSEGRVPLIFEKESATYLNDNSTYFEAVSPTPDPDFDEAEF